MQITAKREEAQREEGGGGQQRPDDAGARDGAGAGEPAAATQGREGAGREGTWHSAVPGTARRHDLEHL